MRLSLRRVATTLAASALAATGLAALPGSTASAAVTRITVDNTHPLMIIPIYLGASTTSVSATQWQDSVVGIWNALPADVKPYTVVGIVNFGSGAVRGSQNERDKITYWLNQAQASNVPVLIGPSTTDGNTTALQTDAWIGQQFDTYSVLKGIMTAEDACRGLDTQVAALDARLLNLVASKGGIFVTNESNSCGFYENIMADANFKAAIAANGANWFPMTKNTYTNTMKNTESVLVGAYLSGQAGGWGVMNDTWDWYNRRYWKYFNGTNSQLSQLGEEDRGVTQPETLPVETMMNGYGSGGMVYFNEHPAYFESENHFTPAFTQGVLPVFRYIIANPVPTKAEVIAQTKVGFWARSGLRINAAFYTNLSGDDGIEPYTTGRYHIIPSFSQNYTAAELAAKFPNMKIIAKRSAGGYDNVSTAAVYSTEAAKDSYVQSLYPAEFSGSAFAEKVVSGGVTRWQAYNNLLNTNTNQSTTINLAANPGKTLGLNLSAHSTAMVKEEANKLTLDLQNYRAEKDDIWANYSLSTPRWNTDVNTLFQDWIRTSYIPNPHDQTLRNTVITVTGLSGAPTLAVGTASPTYGVGTPTSTFANGTYTLTLPQNGSVRVTLTLPPGSGPVTIKQDDSAGVYGAGWATVSEAPLYGGTAHQCKVATCQATFTFTGTGVSWIGQKDSNFGQASVYLDNVLVATVSTYNATNVYQQTLYSVSNLTAGSHTLKIVPTGTHAAPSTDNWMEIDAFTYTS